MNYKSKSKPLRPLGPLTLINNKSSCVNPPTAAGILALIKILKL